VQYFESPNARNGSKPEPIVNARTAALGSYGHWLAVVPRSSSTIRTNDKGSTLGASPRVLSAHERI
jgi:hypothetical protein